MKEMKRFDDAFAPFIPFVAVLVGRLSPSYGWTSQGGRHAQGSDPCADKDGTPDTPDKMPGM